MDEYTIRGREIYSAKGKLVATLSDDGIPVMAPGMAGPHSAKVKAWLGAERGADAADRESDGSDKSDRSDGASIWR